MREGEEANDRILFFLKKEKNKILDVQTTYFSGGPQEKLETSL